MAVLALVLIATWLLLVAGLRTLIQIRRTGDASAPASETDPVPAVVGTAAVRGRLRLPGGRFIAACSEA